VPVRWCIDRLTRLRRRVLRFCLESRFPLFGAFFTSLGRRLALLGFPGRLVHGHGCAPVALSLAGLLRKVTRGLREGRQIGGVQPGKLLALPSAKIETTLQPIHA
jgi:hypothetical protein